MAENGQDEVEEKPLDKHNWGAADLEKVTDFQEERDDFATDNVDHLKAEAPQVISLLAEDVKFLEKELDLRKALAEKYLIEARGDLKACLEHLIRGQPLPSRTR